MKAIFLTLCAEGPSDDMLLPIIRWALRAALGPAVAINDRISSRVGTLDERIGKALGESAGCDLLVVHRDADRKDGHAGRVALIDEAIRRLEAGGLALPMHIRIVPVRMSEA